MSWLKKLRNLLTFSHGRPTFAKQTNSKCEKYANLIRQQDIMLDEYEYLVAAYAERLKESDNESEKGEETNAPTR